MDSVPGETFVFYFVFDIYGNDSLAKYISLFFEIVIGNF